MMSDLFLLALIVMVYLLYRRMDTAIEVLKDVKTAVEDVSESDKGVERKKIKKAKKVLELGGDDDDET